MEEFDKQIMERLRHHLDSARPEAFYALAELRRIAQDEAVKNEALKNGRQASAWAGVALAMDVLRNFVPSW